MKRSLRYPTWNRRLWAFAPCETSDLYWGRVRNPNSFTKYFPVFGILQCNLPHLWRSKNSRTHGWIDLATTPIGSLMSVHRQQFACFRRSSSRPTHDHVGGRRSIPEAPAAPVRITRDLSPLITCWTPQAVHGSLETAGQEWKSRVVLLDGHTVRWGALGSAGPCTDAGSFAGQRLPYMPAVCRTPEPPPSRRDYPRTQPGVSSPGTLYIRMNIGRTDLGVDHSIDHCVR